jgi:hypothetical protein
MSMLVFWSLQECELRFDPLGTVVMYLTAACFPGRCVALPPAALLLLSLSLSLSVCVCVCVFVV